MKINSETEKNITDKLWTKIENDKTKIAKKVYDCMNKDIFSVILDGDVFYFEKTWSGATIPNYVYYYAIKFYEKLGYKYLYHLSK